MSKAHISKAEFVLLGQYPVDYFSRRICVAYVFQRIDLNTSRRPKSEEQRGQKGEKENQGTVHKMVNAVTSDHGDADSWKEGVYWRGVGTKPGSAIRLIEPVRERYPY